MFDKHFAWIHANLLKEFDIVCAFPNRTKWIKEKAFEEFGIVLKKTSDLLVLDNLVKKTFYLDKSDWLREKMREEIKNEYKAREEWS